MTKTLSLTRFDKYRPIQADSRHGIVMYPIPNASEPSAERQIQCVHVIRVFCEEAGAREQQRRCRTGSWYVGAGVCPEVYG